MAFSLIAAAGATLGGYALYRRGKKIQPLKSPQTSKVYLVSASDRIKGIKRIIKRVNIKDFKDRKVAIKANYNSADPFPASTHIDTVRTIVEELNSIGATEIFLAERSGMGDTRRVLEDMRVFSLSKELNFKVIVLDEIEDDGWVRIGSDGLHWLRGFKIAKLFVNSPKIVQTCCLKTHRFGGHFTMSLKNSVGMIAKRDPGGIYDYMAELHTSPFQRQMIAEINRFYKTDLIIMDATEGFVNGGPERGDLIAPNLFIAGNDRVALDAVGVSILRSYGSTPEVMKGHIFELEQIARATELGVGVTSASAIELISLDSESEEKARNIRKTLDT